MSALDIVSKLPVELALHVLEYFTYVELLPVLSTCRAWRQTAIDCRANWSGTMLSAPTEGGAETLAIRLRRANGHPCAVNTHISCRCDTLSPSILRALQSNIRSLSRLSIYTYVSQAQEVLELLRIPGWKLETLEIGFSLDSTDTPLPVLPSDLLQGNSARLRMISLTNVELSSHYSGVFLSVVSVGFGYDHPTETATKPAPDLWSYFPAMRQLRLAGDAIIPELLVSVEEWVQLDWLRLHTSEAALLHMFEHAPSALAQVPHLELPFPAPELEDTLVSHVDGALQVVLHMEPYAEDVVRVCLGDTSWRCSRSILTSLSEFEILSRLDLVARLVSLTVLDILWAAVTRSQSKLPYLTELRLVLDYASGVAFKNLRHAGKLICPSLTRLVLRVDEGEYHVTLSQIRTFVSDGLRWWDPPLELQFEGVTLVGYGRLVPDDETFTYSWKDKGHWTYPYPDSER